MAYYNRGLYWLFKKEFGKALIDYEKAKEINPGRADAHYNIGIIMFNKGNFDESIFAFTNAIQHSEDFSEAYHNRGMAYNKKTNWAMAITDFTKVAKLNPKGGQAYAQRFISLCGIKDFRNAVKDLSTVLQLTGADFESLVKALHTGLSQIWDNEENKAITYSFKDNTNLEITNFEMRILLCYAFWQNDKEFIAGLQFDSIESDLMFDKKPPRLVKEFIIKLLDAMPQSMKKNKDVKTTLKSIKKKIGS